MSSTGEKTVLLKSKKKTRHSSKTESEADSQISVFTFWESLSGTTKVLSGATFFGVALFILSYFVNLKQTIAGDIAKYVNDNSQSFFKNGREVYELIDNKRIHHADHHHIKLENLPTLPLRHRWPTGREKKPLKNCELFAVITTILEVNAAVKNLLSVVKGSCLITLGDRKTNHQEWEDFCKTHVDSCLYLNPDEQLKLPYELVEKVPFNHFGRKSIGFLVAMDYGADQIWDFDDDNHFNLEELEGMKNWKRSVVTPKDTTVHMYNPYVYFNAQVEEKSVMVWPRGFPLNRILDGNNYKTEKLNYKTHADSDYSKIAVFQSLADHDPDVDAIYRMTGKLPVEFKKKKEMVILGENIQCPWNAQGTLIKKPAFWSMLLPITVDGRVSDIWRSYIANKLMIPTGYQLAFTSPIVTQFRNPHSYSKDFYNELDLYNSANKLIELLAEIEIGVYKKEGDETLDEAYLRVFKDVVRMDLLGHEDLALSKAWINDLKSLGYEFPKLVKNAKGYNLKEPKIVDQRDVGPDVVKNLKKMYEFRVRRSLDEGNQTFVSDVEGVLRGNSLF